MTGLLSEFRYAFRALAKSPGFTALAVLTLSLGIGANTAIFSLLDPLLLRDLPVPAPAELVHVNAGGTLGPAEISEYSTYETYRDNATVFSGVIAFTRVAPYQLSLATRSVSASAELVSPNYFSVLGVRPFRGQFFTSLNGAAPLQIVLSYPYWQRSFGSSPAVIGEQVSFGEQSDATRTTSGTPRSYTIVGVAPPDFFGAVVGESPDFYAVINQSALPSQDYWQTQGVTILARLAPGIGIAEAQASLDPLLAEALKRSVIPDVERKEHFAHSVLTSASGGLSPARAQFSKPAYILMAAVALLLLIACSNVANLLLARGFARRKEFTVRIALGASRWRVVRQALVDAATLSAFGGVVGIVLGIWSSRLLVAALSTPQLPIVLASPLNARIFVFAFATLVFTAALCSIAPACSASRAGISLNLNLHGTGSLASSAMPRSVRALIVFQVALSMALLASSGLLVRSLYNLETFDAGFQRNGVLLVSLDGYSNARTRNQVATLFVHLLDRINQIPGIESAAFAGFAPISGKEIGVNIVIDSDTKPPTAPVNTHFVGISPGYFRTLGIPLLAGRDFTFADIHPDSASYQSTNAAIINRSMSHRYFGDANPIGRRFRFVEGNRPPLEIVGLVADAKYTSLREQATDFFYIPGTHGDLAIRTSLSVGSLAPQIRSVLLSLNSNASLVGIRTLRSQLDDSLHPDRLIATLCSIFSALAVLLACIGLFGSLASNVARRTGEIGVRVALGAQPRHIFRLIVEQGFRLAAVGLLFGWAATAVAARFLAGILFNVPHIDVLVYISVAMLLLVSAAVACYFPARRAISIDPLSAIRHE